MNCRPFVITLSHQLGSGAAYIGQKLSERLAVPCLDREILYQVSKQLHLAETELADREQRLSSFWQSFSRIVELMDPYRSLADERYVPTDRELFQLESDTISRIAEKSSAIFIGRCGRYILRDHPCQISVLLHADRAARVRRLAELYHLTPEEAGKLTETNDHERTAYIQTFTRQNWRDAALYDVCLNTTSVGLDQAVELILTCVTAKNG
jgi:cytidylate kinase